MGRMQILAFSFVKSFVESSNVKSASNRGRLLAERTSLRYQHKFCESWVIQ